MNNVNGLWEPQNGYTRIVGTNKLKECDQYKVANSSELQTCKQSEHLKDFQSETPYELKQ